MKIRIEIDPGIEEQEVVIRCGVIDESITQLQSLLLNAGKEKKKIVFYKDETEFYLPLDEVLFFETADNLVWAHTPQDEYQVKYKLYELEELLPGTFMRISKSAILNTRKVYSISRNLTASSLVEFQNSHKQVYVSRNYYKPLKNKLEERRYSDCLHWI